MKAVNELATIQAATEVCTTVKSLVQVYRETRTVNKEKLKIVKDQIQAFRTQQRIEATGYLWSSVARQIAKMDHLISDMELSQAGSGWAARVLDGMSNDLMNIMEEYQNGH